MSSETAAAKDLGAPGQGAEQTPESAGRPSRPTSRWVDLGVPVHYVDHGGPPGAPLLVMVHGLGGSLVTWAALAPLRTDPARGPPLALIGLGTTPAGSD